MSHSPSIVQQIQGSNGGGGTSLSLSLPNVVAGNLLIFQFAVRGGTGVSITTTPAGWTAFRARTDNSTTMSVFTYYKVSTGNDGSTSGFVFTSGKAAGILYEIDDQHPTVATMIHASNGVLNASSTTHTGPTVSVTNASALLLTFHSTANATTAAPNTAGWTETTEDNTTSGGAATTRVSVEGQQRIAGATGNFNSSALWGTAAAGATHTIAIAPSPYVEPGPIALSGSGNMTAFGIKNYGEFTSQPTSSSVQNSAGPLTFSHTTGTNAGQAVFIGVSTRGTTVPQSTAVSWNGMTATLVGRTSIQADHSVELWVVRDVPANTAGTVSIAWGTTRSVSAGAFTLPDVGSSSTLTYAGSGGSTGVSPSVTVASNVTDRILAVTQRLVDSALAPTSTEHKIYRLYSGTEVLGVGWVKPAAATSTTIGFTPAASTYWTMGAASVPTVQVKTSGAIALSGTSRISTVASKIVGGTDVVAALSDSITTGPPAISGGNLVYTFTLAFPVPQGRIVRLAMGAKGASTIGISSITDSKGNTWTELSTQTVSNVYSRGWVALASTAFDIGDTITVTLSAVPTTIIFDVRYISNAANVFTGVSGQSASAATSSVTENVASSNQLILPAVTVDKNTTLSPVGVTTHLGTYTSGTSPNDVAMAFGRVYAPVSGTNYTYGWNFGATSAYTQISALFTPTILTGAKTSGAVAMSGSGTLTATGTKVAGGGGGGGYSDITFVAKGTAFSYATGTNIAPTVPTVQTGDLLLAFIVFRDQPSTMTAVPSGWTLIPGDNPFSASTDTQIFVYYKVSDGSESGTNPAWTASASGAGIASIAAWRGVNTTTPIDVNSIGAASATSGVTAQVIPDITTVTDKACVISALGADDEATIADMFSFPAPFTEREDVEGGANVFLGYGDAIRATAGLWTSPGTITTTTGDFYAMQTFALRPAGSAPSGTTKTSGAVALSGTATLTPTAHASKQSGTIALSGIATIGASARTVKTGGSTALSAAGNLAANGSKVGGSIVKTSGAVALSGIASTTASARRVARGTSGGLALSGSGTLTATASKAIPKTSGAVALSGTATLGATAKRYNLSLTPIVDNFNDNSLGAEWEAVTTGSFTVTNQNDRLEFSGSAASVGRAILRTYKSQTLTANAYFIEAVQVFPAQTAYRVAFGYGDIVNTTTAFVEIVADYTSSQRLVLRTQARNGVASITVAMVYNPAQHRFWRIREAAGYIYADVSTDSVTWVHPDALDDGNTAWRVQTSTLGGWSLDQDPIYFVAEATTTAGTLPPTAVFDNLEIDRVPEFTNTTKTSGPLNLSGAANLTAVVHAIRKSGAVANSGTANLTANARAIRKSAAVALSGAGNATANARRIQRAASPLTASGNLTSSARVVHVSGAVALTGTSTATVTAHGIKQSGPLSFSGISTLNASAAQQAVRTSGAVALTATGTTTATAHAIRKSAAISLSGIATTTATAHGIKKSSLVAMSGTATLTSAARRIDTSGAVALVGNSNLTASARAIRKSGAVALSGTSTLTDNARRIQVRTATFTASGNLTAFAGLSSGAGAIPLSASGTLTATGRRIARSTTTALSASGTLTATARKIVRSQAVALSGTATTTAVGRTIKRGTILPLSGTATITATARRLRKATAAFTATGTLTIQNRTIRRGGAIPLSASSAMIASAAAVTASGAAPIGGLIRIEGTAELGIVRVASPDTIFVERIAPNDAVLMAGTYYDDMVFSATKVDSDADISLQRLAPSVTLTASRSYDPTPVVTVTRESDDL